MKQRCNPIAQWILSVVALFVVTAASLFAQANIGLYTYQSEATTINNPSSDLTTTVFSAGTDDALSSVINLPFTFYYNGAPYDRIVISSNGWAALGRSTNNPVFPGSLSSVPSNDPDAWQFANTPMIAPLWDNLTVGFSGAVSYTSNANEFRVRWRQMEWGTTNIFITFELTLSSGPCAVKNHILFSYGTGSQNAGQSATVGILSGAGTVAPNNYLVFNGAVSPANTSNNAQANPATRLVNYNNLPANASIAAHHYNAIYVEGPTTLDFGQVSANGGTSTRSFTVRNIGCNDVSLNNGQVTPSNAQYTVPGFSATLVPNGTRAISLQFTGTCPLTVSPVTGTATFVTSVPVIWPGSNSFVSMSAQEIHPAVSGGSITAFGAMALGGSVARTITLTNSGNEAYNGTLSISGTGSNQYSISPNPVSIPAGGSTVVTVTFTPDGATHAANANTNTWIAAYTNTLTVPEGNQTCNGGTILTRSLSASSLAPRINVNVPFSTEIPGNQLTPLIDLGNREYRPVPGNFADPLDYANDFQVTNSGSAPVTISSINRTTGNILSDRFGATAVLYNGTATLNPGQMAGYRVSYDPQTTTNDFSWTQASSFGVRPAVTIGSTNYQFSISAATPVPASPGYWKFGSSNLGKTAQLDAEIQIFRGFMRLVRAQSNPSQQAPTDPNGAPTLAGGLQVPNAGGTVNVGNGSNGGSPLSVTSYYGQVGDRLPNNGVVTQAGQPGTVSFYVVNNGSASARYYVRKNVVNDNVNPGAFSLSVPIVGNAGIIVGSDIINGVDYHTFTLEPLFAQVTSNNKAWVRFDITFTPNATNTPSLATIGATRGADIQILTDANLPSSAAASTAPRNDLSPYVVRVNGSTLFNDPEVIVANTGQSLAGGLNFGTHDLANRISSDYPFGAWAPAGLGYSAPAEEVNRRGGLTGPSGPVAFGVRDTVVTIVLRNRGNAPMDYNNIGDIQALTNSFSPGTFSIVRITTPQLISAAGSNAPAQAAFPFTLQPYTSGGSGQQLVVWLRYDAGSRFSGQIGQSSGQVRAIQSNLLSPVPHTTSISYTNGIIGNSRRPFPVTAATGADGSLGVVDGPTRTTPRFNAWRPADFDNYCSLGNAPQNRDSVHISVMLGNGAPAPTLVGNVNDAQVSPVNIDLGNCDMDSLNGNLRIYNNTKSFEMDWNLPVYVLNNLGQVVNTINVSNPSNRVVTLNPGQRLKFTIVFRPSALMPPSVGDIRALVKIPHNARNNNRDFPVETGASQTNTRSNPAENGDVYKTIDFVVSGSSLRPAFRLELGNYAQNGVLGNYLAPNSTVSDFNLAYPYKPGVFVGDSSFVALTLRNGVPSGSNIATGRIGIKGIFIEGVDFPDFEIVGFGLPVGTVEPNRNIWPVSSFANALASGSSFIQWVAEVGNTSIGQPYVLDRLMAGKEAVSLYVHFKPREQVNGSYKELRNAVVRIVTTDICQPELIYNIRGNALHADITCTPSGDIRFGNVQHKDVAQRSVVLKNTGNSPAYFDVSTIPFVGGTPLYSHNFSLMPLGVSLFSTTPPINFNVVGDTRNPIFPGNSRQIEVQFSPQTNGFHEAIMSTVYVPRVGTQLPNGNIKQQNIQGYGVPQVELSIVPANGVLNFGDVFIGASSTKPFVITNNGGTTVTVELPPVSIGEFSHNITGVTEISLAPNASATIQFTYTPTNLGDDEATFTISVPDAFGQPEYKVVCLGTGVSSSALSAPSLNFGIVRVFTERSQPLYVNNSQNPDPVNVSFNGISGLHYGEYSLRMNGNIVSPGYNFTVPANTNSANFEVLFSPNTLPSSSGTINLRTATLDFTIDGAQHTVALSGDGAVPQIAFKGADVVNGKLNFGIVPLNQAGTRMVSVVNVGRFPLEIIQIQTVGSDAGEFAVSNIQNVVLNNGESLQLNVTLIPGSSSTGTLSARLTANSNSLTPRSVELEGSRAVPMLGLSPSSFFFAQTRVGEVEDRTLSIKNLTGRELQVRNLTIAGAGASDYRITGTSHNLPATLAIDEEMTVTLRFAPTSNGDKPAKIYLETQTGNQTVELFGRAYAPGIGFSPQQLNFRNIPVQQSRELMVSVSNTGIVPVKITKVEIVGDDAAMFRTDVQSGFTLEAGETRNVAVTFTPLNNGVKFATLKLTTDFGDPLTAMLFGSGGAPAISVADTKDFGYVEHNQFRELQLAINNNGDSPLEITEALVEGGSKADFTVHTPMPVLIASGGASLITVRYQPGTEGPGERRALLRLVNNTGTPAEVELVGSTMVVGVKGPDGKDISFGFGVSYPNPFTEYTTLQYAVPSAGNVHVSVIDQLGNTVAVLVNEYKAAGDYTVRLEAKGLAAGAYVVRLQAAGQSATSTITLVK